MKGFVSQIEEIVERDLARIRNDLKEVPGLKKIDFVDIFPTSENHREMLDAEMCERATVLQQTERGNVYLLDEPIKTSYGDLKYVKIRIFDPTRLNWESAADFKVEDRQISLDKVGKDKRFSYIERPDWNAVEFKTDDILVYFLEPLASEIYEKEGEEKVSVVEQIKALVQQKSEDFLANDPGKFDFWNEHLKYVDQEATDLADKYGADLEIVQLGALLHDIALLEKVGTKSDHHENGKKLAEEILRKYDYPEDRIERVLGCVLHHRSSKNAENLEELCVADADILAHFDNIPMLFDTAYYIHKVVGVENAREFMRKTFEEDFDDLSERTKQEFEPRYRMIYQFVIGEKI